MADHGNVIVINSRAEWDAALNTPNLVIVDFFATWCGPCRFISPKIVEMSKTYTNVTFLKVDVDQLPELAEQLGVNAMPTFQAFRNKEKVGELIGANEAKLRALVEKHK